MRRFLPPPPPPPPEDPGPNYVNVTLLAQWEKVPERPPPPPPRRPLSEFSPFDVPKVPPKNLIPREDSCSNFGGIPTLEEQSLSDLDCSREHESCVETDYEWIDGVERGRRVRGRIRKSMSCFYQPSPVRHLINPVHLSRLQHKMELPPKCNISRKQLSRSTPRISDDSSPDASSGQDFLRGSGDAQVSLIEKRFSSLSAGDDKVMAGSAAYFNYSSDEGEDDEEDEEFISSCSDSLFSKHSFASSNGTNASSVFDFDDAANAATTPFSRQQRSSASSDDTARALFHESSYSGCGNFGVSCKTGWLDIKHMLYLRKRKLEPVQKRKWRRFWCCVRGTRLFLYNDTDIHAGADPQNAEPSNVIALDNCLVQPLPEHPRRENILKLSTSYGDVFMIQCTTVSDMHSWTTTIHKVCGHAAALNKNSEDTVALLKMDLLKKEQLCEDLTGRDQENSLEKHQCDIFRLRCYLSALTGTELPNPKTLLCLVSKDTKGQLSRINCFSVCAVHALQAGKSTPNPKNGSNSLERPKRSMFSILRSKDFSSKDESKSKSLKRRNSQFQKTQQESLDDSITCSPCPKERMAIWDHEEKGKLARISLLHNQTTVVPVLPNTTVQDVLERCCRKRKLDHKDHFIRTKECDQWVLPPAKSLLANHVCEVIELCKKEYTTVELLRSKPGEPYGFTFEVSNVSPREMRLFILDVLPGSVASVKGLSVGDEIVEIDQMSVSCIDQALIDFHLKQKSSLTLKVRSHRPSTEACQQCCRATGCSSGDDESITEALTSGQSAVQRLVHIIHELVTSEQRYITDLSTFFNLYVEPLHLSSLFSESTEIHQLYETVCQLLPLQQSFFAQLSGCLPAGGLSLSDNPTLDQIRPVINSMLNVIDGHVESFKIYSKYCANYETASRTFQSAMQETEFQLFLQQCNPEHQQSQNLESYLIKPIQRVLKYPLLLRDLRDHYPGKTAESERLSTTHESMQSLAAHINDLQRVYQEYHVIFEQLLIEQEFRQIDELPLDQLLAYGPVTWTNCPLEDTKSSGKTKQCPMMLFVFKTAIILIPNYREKKKRKVSLVAQPKMDDSGSRQKPLLMPSSTTTLVPEDSTEHFSLDFTEFQYQTQMTTRFTLACKDTSSSRRAFEAAINSCCAPTTQIRKRNARKQGATPTALHVRSRHLQDRSGLDLDRSFAPATPAVPTGSARLTSRSPSPVKRNTQVDSGVFSDENTENSNAL